MPVTTPPELAERKLVCVSAPWSCAFVLVGAELELVSEVRVTPNPRLVVDPPVVSVEGGRPAAATTTASPGRTPERAAEFVRPGTRHSARPVSARWRYR